MADHSDTQAGSNADPPDDHHTDAENAADAPDDALSRIDSESVMYLAAGLAASVLVHAGVVGLIALFDQWQWSLRADFTWEADDAKLRQVGLGPAPQSAAADIETSAAPEQKTQSAAPKTDPSPADADNQNDADRTPPDTSDETSTDPQPAEESTPDDEPAPDEPDTRTRTPSEPPTTETDDAPDRDTSETSADQTGSSDSDAADFDADRLGRAGPANLPNLDKFAPGNARYTTLIRIDRLRGTPYQSELGNLFSALPDYRLLAASTDLDPIEQLDTIFFASARPQYLPYTFIAIRHRLSQTAVKRAVDARYPDPPPWETRRQLPMRRLVPPGYDLRDPRRIILADNGLTLIARPEWLERLSAAFSDASQDDESTPAATPDSSDDEAPPGSMIAGLRRIEQVAADGDTIVLLSAYGGTPRLPQVGRLRGFDGVRLEISNPDQPTLAVDIHFDSPDAARDFTANFPRIRRALVDAIPLGSWLDLDTYVTRLKATRTDNFVQVRASYSPDDVKRLAGLFGQFIPRPPALESLPSPPPPATQKDAGPAGGGRDASHRQPPPNEPASSGSSSPDVGLTDRPAIQTD